MDIILSYFIETEWERWLPSHYNANTKQKNKKEAQKIEKLPLSYPFFIYKIELKHKFEKGCVTSILTLNIY